MTQFATRQQRILGQVNSVLIPAALKCLNFRIAHYDRSVDPARPEYNEHVIFAFWHEYISLVLPTWGRTPLTILVSQHRDGEWVNQTGEFLRLNIVRGSTSRGGSSAIRQLKKNAKFSSLALATDGPRGPRREMATGAIFLASLLKIPLVPVGVGMDRPWRLKTWDKFAIPRPFSKTRMIFGPKIRIAPKLGRERLEATRLSVQSLMNQLCDEADEWATTDKKFSNEQPFTRARSCRQLVFPEKKTDIRLLSPKSEPSKSEPSKPEMTTPETTTLPTSVEKLMRA